MIGPGNAVLASWPLEGSTAPDLALVDALARFHLAARRLGWTVVVDDACPALNELFGLAGLREVLQIAPVAATGGDRPES